ncbi:2-hydroxyglutaryl-CoA dehydratase, D-component [Desulfacinum hydrothermale DSM 13146]|uniref:2-hydroxyglutaryl-CoA dehydratase, D-component n=1 Tax=Desulfacinum hydrothermale DSM 13146 TaxID=1121390 RepID=A0A1W1XJK9_9BACT|nr:2-hydroxyacyl-CoA dehydratase family protein [Desulfacinum hydrothermale]SMC23987.1 2-hydroxyglutaryl-CoA dehydratase, D-component [Desulfacinum hydrothermale DSM 13146]
MHYRERFMISLVARALLTGNKLKTWRRDSALDAIQHETLRLLAHWYGRKRPKVLAGFFFPVELLHAHGVIPMFGEFVATAMAAAGLEKNALSVADAEGFPVESCAFHRASLAALLKGYLPPLDAVAATTHLCDSQCKALEELAVRLGVPFIVLDVPQEDTAEARTYLVRQMEEADGVLAGLSGKSPGCADWRRVFAFSNSARDRMLRLNALRATAPAGVCGKEMATALIQSQLFLGLEMLPPLLERLALEIPSTPPPPDGGHPKYRLVWLLTFPYFKGNFIPFMEQTLGLWPVLDELTHVFWDPLDPERPYESLAVKMLQNPGLGPVDRRLRWWNTWSGRQTRMVWSIIPIGDAAKAWVVCGPWRSS